jgi:hypothetical protein
VEAYAWVVAVEVEVLYILVLLQLLEQAIQSQLVQAEQDLDHEQPQVVQVATPPGLASLL